MKIDVAHLSTGLHKLDFEETREELEIEDSYTFPNLIFVSVRLDKGEAHLYLKVSVRTRAHFVCDRCLEEFDTDISGDLKLYYSKTLPEEEYASYFKEFDDEVRLLSAGLTEIDITKDVRDTLLLAIPMKKLCREDCKGLCPRCGHNLNQGPCNCSQETIDPRWAALKKLLGDNGRE